MSFSNQKVLMSKFAMDVILSPSVVYFFEAHLPCSERVLEDHFKQFGQVCSIK